MRAKSRRIEWDDLQYVLAVADAGTLVGAANALRVNRTTVLRRINAFERKHGVRLFERLQSGYRLTAGGEEILAAARGLEDTIVAVERRLAGQDSRAEGLVHVTTTDTLLGSVLGQALVSFREEHPRIVLDISVSNTLLNLSKRDADVAIRPVAEAPDTLIGRRICTVAFAIYVSAAYAATRKLDSQFSEHNWIAPDESLASTSVARWMSRHVPDAKRTVRVDSLLAIREMCAAGAGLAALPCYLADVDDRLVRAHQPIKEMSTALWVLTHPDLVRTARVRLFTDYIVRALGQQRAVFEGVVKKVG